MIGIMVVLFDVFSRMVSIVLVPRGVDPILCNGYGIQ